MKKRLQGMIAGVLIGAMLTSGVVFAKQISETAELYYNNIKLYIDGGEIVPKDANGNVVEPFTMNGTTYLPVRAVSNAFGKDVEWDGATQSIYIGKKDQTKPDNYLDRIQYNDFREAGEGDDFAIINGTITDYNKNIYTNGLLFFVDWHRELKDDIDQSDILVAYPLNSQYNNLKGKIVIPKEYNISTWGQRSCNSASNDVFFYGDGNLLYKATGVTSSMPFNLDIDVKGVNQLTVKIKCANNSSTHIALTDLALYK
ncbi:MAG: NPCBM/NEW2 domain-containing protein [Clostridia bacterium]|nr:NPCBM/NEW2 domain-containing protein [Clostridia bacterium]